MKNTIEQTENCADIVNRYLDGTDCTENESAEIKQFVKKLDYNNPKEHAVYCLIREYMISEYTEACEEMIKEKHTQGESLIGPFLILYIKKAQVTDEDCAVFYKNWINSDTAPVPDCYSHVPILNGEKLDNKLTQRQNMGNTYLANPYRFAYWRRAYILKEEETWPENAMTFWFIEDGAILKYPINVFTKKITDIPTIQ